MPIGSSTRSVTKSACQPKVEKSTCRLSAKKLKYLKKPSTDRLKTTLTARSALRRDEDSAR
jgi:hypothetical protein